MTGALAAVRTLREHGGCENSRNVTRAATKCQLALAKQAGLRIPKTVITNQPTEVDRAFKTFGSLVVKPVRSGHVVHAGEERAIFTSRVLEEHLTAVDDAKWCPAIYGSPSAGEQMDVRTAGPDKQ
jgi:hypothetical protein